MPPIRQRNALRNVRRGACLLALAAALLAPAGAAPVGDAGLRFERVASDLGLSQNAVTSILQDRKGFLWFGTRDGLNRFDGYEFKIYRYDSFDPRSLSDSDVGVLYEDRAGRLWVGTRNGLNLYDRSREVFHRLLSNDSDPQSLYNHSVSGIVGDARGSIWVATYEGGLLRLDLAAEPGDDPLAGARLTRIPFPAAERASTLLVLGLQIDAAGTIWADTTEGLHLVTPTADGATVERFRVGLLGEDVADAVERRGSRILLCNGSEGVAFVGIGPGVLVARDGARDFDYHRFDTSRGLPGPISDWDAFWNEIKWMIRAGDGRIWMGALWGLLIFDPATGSLESLAAEPGDERGIPASGFTSVLEDAGGVIWLGSNGNGLYRYDPKAARFGRPQRGSNRLALWRGASVRAICETRGGEVWFSTPAIELFRLDRSTGATVRLDLPRSRGLYQIISILEDRAGALWFGGTGELIRLTPSTGAILDDLPAADDPAPFAGRAVKVYEDRAGALWAATYDALFRFDPATETFTPFRFGLDTSPATGRDVYPFVFEDREGVFWAAAAAGLVRLDPRTGAVTSYRNDPKDPTSLSHDVVRSICDDPAEPDRVLWVGTAGGGLNRFDKQSGRFEHLTEADGLPNNVVYAILDGGDGSLWMSTNNGLARFDPRHRSFRTFDVSDGLQDNEFNSCAAFRSASGELFFGGIAGFNAFHPSEIRDNPHAPPVVVTRFRLSNRPVSLYDADSPLRQSIVETTELTLSYDQKIFSFEFAALDYTQPSKNRYLYKMENFNDDWQAAGTDRMATYTNLDPGEYVFRVIGSNNDGVWNTEGASIRVRILPPWWRTWWASLAYGVLTLAAVVGFVRLRTWQYEQRSRELGRIVDERTAELQLRNAEIVAAQEKLIVQEKLASLGQLTAGIAHEIKNPLNFVTNFADLSVELADELRDLVDAQGDALAPDVRASLLELVDLIARNAGRINEHGRRADGIVRGMLMHSRGESGDRVPMDVNALLDEYVGLAYHGMRGMDADFNVAIDKDYDPTIGAVLGFPHELSRVILNLVHNACYATQAKKREQGDAYGPLLTVCTKSLGDSVEIRIRDNGNGIPKEVRDKIFTPFFTTKPAGHGTGLGLSIAYEIVVQRHGGELRFETEAGEFTEFIITLPKDAKGGSPS